jgi:hypothetical protein
LRERKAKNNNKSSSTRKDFSTSRHDDGSGLVVVVGHAGVEAQESFVDRPS